MYGVSVLTHYSRLDKLYSESLAVKGFRAGSGDFVGLGVR